jgi:hypothetical protein
MGLEYKIETFGEACVDLPAFFRRLPEFLREHDGAFHFGSDPSTVLFTVASEADHLYICQHVASRETDALLGLVILACSCAQRSRRDFRALTSFHALHIRSPLNRAKDPSIRNEI